MKEINRQLAIDLPNNQSAFLWGARKTGKTTLLRKKFPISIFIDFLQTDTFLEYTKSPFLLRERLLARPEQAQKHPIIIDEVQKVPQVLDEVHWLIENKGLNFILCGSSARKLKRGQANLLGGRAWRFELFPLVSNEVKDLDLLRGCYEIIITFTHLCFGSYLNDPQSQNPRCSSATPAVLFNRLVQVSVDSESNPNQSA